MSIFEYFDKFSGKKSSKNTVFLPIKHDTFGGRRIGVGPKVFSPFSFYRSSRKKHSPPPVAVEGAGVGGGWLGWAGWWLVAGGWWLAGGWWWLVVAGGWWLVAGGWWLAGGWWRLVVAVAVAVAWVW